MGSLTSWTPRAEIDALSPFTRDPFFRRFFNLMDSETEDTGRWLPSVNVYESKSDLIVEFDMPGVEPKSVEVNLHGDTLTVSGERRPSMQGEDVKLLRGEPGFGRFQRSLRLPVQVDADKVKAKAEHGVMRVTMPKAKEFIGRQIPIQIA